MLLYLDKAHQQKPAVSIILKWKIIEAFLLKRNNSIEHYTAIEKNEWISVCRMKRF